MSILGWLVSICLPLGWFIGFMLLVYLLSYDKEE